MVCCVLGYYQLGHKSGQRGRHVKKLFETDRWVAYQYHGAIVTVDQRQPSRASLERRRQEVVAQIEELSRAPLTDENRRLLSEARVSLAILDDDDTPISQEVVHATFADMLQLPEDGYREQGAHSSAVPCPVHRIAV
jgi:hypothetical protein